MKKNLSIAALAVALVLNQSCSQAPLPEAEVAREDLVELSVTLQSDAPTKGQTAWTKEQENSVSSWQVFVFNSDGSLDVCAQVTGSAGTSLKCTTGQKKVYALVNHPSDLTGAGGIHTETELLSQKSGLSDNVAGTRFVMFGEAQTNLTSAASLSIEVNRLCSKVYIDNIENKLPGSYGSVTVKGIYLTNAAGDAVFGDKTYLPGTSGQWYNKMAYSASGVAAVETLLSESSLSEVIAKGEASAKPHYFYCYPNVSENTAQAGQWSPRCTRLVIETVVESDSESKRYYVIRLMNDSGEGIGRNKYYHINKLVINHLGTTDPDKEADMNTLSVSLTVKDWTEGFEKEEVYY